MTKHWVRDLPVTDPTWYIANGNHIMGNAVLYNFLRVAGWERLWECDGTRLGGTRIGPTDPNHVQDGNVQADNLASWSAYVGATISKDTTKFHSGTRSLKVVAGASGQGVSTISLLSMVNAVSFSTGTGDVLSGPVGREMTYTDTSAQFNEAHVGQYLRIWGDNRPANNGDWIISRWMDTKTIKFENPAGVPVAYFYNPSPPPPSDIALYSILRRYEIMTWVATDVAVDVEVDQGDGSYVNVGTIPANGSTFTRYGDITDSLELFFKKLSTGAVTIRFVAQGAGTFYVGGLNVYSSIWEKPALTPQGTDGILTNPDRFSTAGSFTPDGTDVGKTLFVYDPTNNKNSGAYPIIADLGGGIVQLDLRSGSAALTTQSGLAWRIANIDYREYPNANLGETANYIFIAAGFGFQSPHISGWRYFLRQAQFGGQTGKGSAMWSSPEDTDFDFSTGSFFKTGPSTMRNRQVDWWPIPDSAVWTGQHLWRGGYSYKTSPHDSRIFMLLDEDGAFFNFFIWDEDVGHGCHLHGYLGSDLPDIESFYLFSRWENRSAGSNECGFDNDGSRFGFSGTSFGANGLAIPACIAQLGMTTAASPGASPEGLSNAGVNPWSGREWLRPLILWRDPDMSNPEEAAMQNSDVGLYQMRINKSQLTTFESNLFLHLVQGFVWEWSGETLVP